MVDRESVLQIAAKIKDARLAKGYTLQQLAHRCNISKGLLSKIENSRTIPSLPVFIAIVQALELSLKQFFEDMIFHNGKTYLHIPATAYTPLPKEERPGFSYQFIITQTLPPCGLEAVLLTVEGNTTGTPTSSDGYEFKYILSGACDYQIQNELVHLQQGDTIYFDATRPHRPINRSAKPVVMLVLYFLTS
jgi:transcriptional regulator with XRE-family HTH domain